MRFTGLSEFLFYGLVFAAIIGFNIFKQVLAARREQQLRRERAGYQAQTMEPTPVAVRHPLPPELTEADWGRASEPDPDEPVMPAPPVVKQPMEVVLAREREQRRKLEREAARQAVVAAARPRRRLLHTRRELRHGIVLMTVLGPCRALQPYDQDHG